MHYILNKLYIFSEVIYLKLNVDELILRKVVTAVSNTIHMSVGASQAFIVKVLDKERTLETMILAAPDTDTNATGHLFECEWLTSMFHGLSLT